MPATIRFLGPESRNSKTLYEDDDILKKSKKKSKTDKKSKTEKKSKTDSKKKSKTEKK